MNLGIAPHHTRSTMDLKQLKILRAIAETGVDYVSSGALTHSAVNLDIGLDIEM